VTLAADLLFAFNRARLSHHGRTSGSPRSPRLVSLSHGTNDAVKRGFRLGQLASDITALRVVAR